MNIVEHTTSATSGQTHPVSKPSQPGSGPLEDELQQPDHGYARKYAEAIMWRGRIPMEPATFVPDWSDRPRKWKHFPGLDSYPLPDAEPGGSVGEGLFAGSADRSFTLSLLGGLLRDTYGLLGRRLAIQGNTDVAALPRYAGANWHRGAASGGGLYPVTVTLVAGGGGPLLPGVYHYAPQQHALRPLLVGDVSGEVRAALRCGSDSPESDSDHFLVLGVKYWQNAFKYNNFCFHAVSMDVGAAAQAMRTWARAAGVVAEPRWFFDERRLTRLLGVDDHDEDEGVFAVVPLRWGSGPARSAGPSPATAVDARVGHRDMERSRRILTFDTVGRMQRATRQEHPGSPPPDALVEAKIAHPAGPAHVVLPAVDELPEPMRQALRTRRSSFGRFDARTRLPLTALATALAAAASAAEDTFSFFSAGAGLVGHYVFVNHVAGLRPGTYQYADGQLWLIAPEPPGDFVQRNYFLANYNLERAGVVIVPAMRTTAVLDAVGDRGYRLVNASIGAIAQNVYVTSSALGLGCGVALGFDNVSYVEHLGLADDQVPLLIMMLGADRAGSADFRYELA
jgi:SagB-type dehydrogenase family enzyme